MKRGSQEKKASRSPKRQHHSEIISTVEEKSNGFLIPLDLTVDILSRLPVKSLVRFQIVSKQWSCLVIDSIVARCFTQPRLLVIFPHWLHQTSLFSPSTCPMITSYKTFISALTRTRGISCDFEYQYIRGLICCNSSDEFADILKFTKRHSVIDVPEINNDKYSNSCDGFLGYDPVEKQVFTLVGGPKKQQWESLDIQGTWKHSPAATSNGLCINGIIYYIAHIDVGMQYPESNELVWFDVRCERFGHTQMPITLQLEELTLVNYQGKLGCISYTNDSVEMWIMEDHHDSEKQEWSKIILCMPHVVRESLRDNHCIAGVTPIGEIVTIPKTLESDQPLCACYYDPKQNTSRKVVFGRGN